MLVYIHININKNISGFLVKVNFNLHDIIFISLSFKGRTGMLLYIQNEIFQ